MKKYSDTLLIFLLKALNPEKYRDRREISGSDGDASETTGTIINVTVDEAMVAEATAMKPKSPATTA